ncbi:MAG: outer membrane lipoprotein-sorting protein [Verrucomicrobia bacterium]|nr:MAG: outer membrane lipoprotein-sorting protein [Verrucomicrobiota bacterium]
MPVAMQLNLAALAIALISNLAVQAQTPDARTILEGARMAASLTQLDEGLSGNLKKDGKSVPVTLFLKGKDIQFQIEESQGAPQIFHLRLNDNSFDLFEMSDGKTLRFPDAKLVQAIAGTDVTYEDLALRFFYWPNPKFEAEETINGETCYKLRLDKPKDSSGRYAAVYIWVHKKYGAFMRIQGFDKSGGLVKEFQVQDVMQVSDKVWTLEKMQVATHDPTTGRRLSITNLLFEKPKHATPRGLR